MNITIVKTLVAPLSPPPYNSMKIRFSVGTEKFVKMFVITATLGPHD